MAGVPRMRNAKNIATAMNIVIANIAKLNHRGWLVMRQRSIADTTAATIAAIPMEQWV